MGRVREAIEKTVSSGRKALIPYIVAGYPSLEASLELLLALQEAGATCMEVGIPFSDPMADGPVIQKAHARALEGGVTPGAILDALGELGDALAVPVVLMTYYNPVFRMGEGSFARRAREAGAAGVIIPDLPPEEAGEWVRVAGEEEVDTVFLVAPNTPPERVGLIASVTTGFLYYLALKGVTGSAIEDLQGVARRVTQVKEAVDLPVCVGFGVSRPEEAAALAQGAHGVIVGSALIRALEKGGKAGLLELFDSLKKGLKGP